MEKKTEKSSDSQEYRDVFYSQLKQKMERHPSQSSTPGTLPYLVHQHGRRKLWLITFNISLVVIGLLIIVMHYVLH